MSNMLLFRCSLTWLLSLAIFNCTAPQLRAQNSSSSQAHSRTEKILTDGPLDMGSVSNGIYRNSALKLTCKIPEGWVLRTDEMNSNETNADNGQINDKPVDSSKPNTHASSNGSKVLLAAFSRPPEAKGEDVNSSIVIAAEPVSAYPGLTEAEQYLTPLTEVAEASGFAQDGDACEITVGPRTLVRADFNREVGSRVMRQATLAMLSEGYAVSITFIAGTADQLEDLVEGLDFSAPASTRHAPK